MNIKLAKYEAHFNTYAKQKLPQNKEHAGDAYQAIHYSFYASGSKRVRPLLIYTLADSLGIPTKKVDNLALAIECIHTYSLIHDDLPVMDNDDLRRGQLSCHKKFNVPTAILAGDALNTLAFEILSQPNEHTNTKQQLKQIQLLSKCAGIDGMVGGQDTDLFFEKKSINVDLKILSQLHSQKTAKLIEACFLGTYYMANNIHQDNLVLLSDAALSLGLFYQIQDDILDVTQSSRVLGKPSGSDVAKNKSTYVSLLSLPSAKNEAKKQITIVNDKLTRFFSPKKQYWQTPMAKIIQQISQRSH